MPSIPVWAMLLVAAAVAPTLVRAYARSLDRKVRSRTEATIARARARAGAAPPVSSHEAGESG